VKMTGRLILSCMMAFLLVFAVSFVVVAQDEGPETIVIKSPLWPEPTKAPVTFSHQKHAEDYKIACDDCHHVYEGGKNVWEPGDPVQPCHECHTNAVIQGEKKLPEAEQKLNLKLAYHDNCIGCHKKVKAENKETTAPVTCTGCHPKE